MNFRNLECRQIVMQFQHIRELVQMRIADGLFSFLMDTETDTETDMEMDMDVWSWAVLEKPF